MKRIGKPIIFIVAAILLAFAVLSAVGIESRFGDNRTIHLKGIDTLAYGYDMAGGIVATFTTDAEDATPDDVRQTELRMRERLSEYGVVDGSVVADYERKEIVVRFSAAAIDIASPDTILSDLGSVGAVTIYDGETQEEEDTEGEDRADKLIADYNDIKKVTVTPEGGSNSVRIYLKSDAAKRLKDMSARASAVNTSTGNAEEGTQEKYSIWLDSTSIVALAPTEEIKDGVLALSHSGTFRAARQVAFSLSGKPNRIAFTAGTASTIQSPNGNHIRKIVGIALLAAFLAAAAFLIIRFKVPGGVAVISLLGLGGWMIGWFTGLFQEITYSFVNLPAVIGAVLGFGITIDLFILISARIKQYADEGKTLDAAIISSFKRSRREIYASHIFIAVLCLLLMGLFGPKINFVTDIFSWLTNWLGFAPEGTIFSFANALLGTVLWNMVITFPAAYLMMRSVSKFKKLRSIKFYGGKPSEAE